MRATIFRTASMAAAALTLATALPVGMPTSADAESVTTTTKTTTVQPGPMTIVSREARTFRVGDATTIYTAPPSVDLSMLDGSDVNVVMAPDGRVSSVTRIEETTTDIDD